jgi:error-prone DNA polymerase
MVFLRKDLQTRGIMSCQILSAQDGKRLAVAGLMQGVTGMLQKEGDVVHLVAKEISDFSGLLADVGNRSSTDNTHNNDSDGERLVVRSRNFH